MNNLITAQEFAAFRNISKKIDTSKVDESISLAQSVDLMDILGDFLFDVIENKDDVGYTDLMSGSTFTINNQNYIQAGLKSLIADLTYARYMYIINTNITPFGAQSKFTDDSQPVDRNFLKDITKQTQIDASIKFKMIDKYLRANSTTFTRYNKGNDSSINTFSQNYTVIK
ncbi:DUF6712 family protein [Bizionia psychrotolerans]|uniref:DUF6712 family protein n=1 Tax=Bizionia psychrotolerans TaxID=1492901 RepID=UPI0006517135|nr:hypothetical protein [Bizionia psychrotolerans]